MARTGQRSAGAAAQGEKTASAGWYNLAAAQRRARAAGRALAVINGDAFSREIEDQTIARLKQAGRKLDLVVYSLAAPKRVDAADGVSYSSVLKPLGAPFRSKSINLGNEQVVTVESRPPRTPRWRRPARSWGGGLRRLGARAGGRRSAGAGLPRGGLQLRRPGADLPDLPLGDHREGQGGPGEDDRGAVCPARGAGGRCRLCERQQGVGHAGCVRHPGRPALHQPALQGDEGGRDARGDRPADRAALPRPPGAGPAAADRQ